MANYNSAAIKSALSIISKYEAYSGVVIGQVAQAWMIHEQGMAELWAEWIYAEAEGAEYEPEFPLMCNAHPVKHALEQFSQKMEQGYLTPYVQAAQPVTFDKYLTYCKWMEASGLEPLTFEEFTA